MVFRRIATPRPGTLVRLVGRVRTLDRSLARLVRLRPPRVRGLARRARRLVRVARERWSNRPAARIRELRLRARSPLPNLYDVHPEARLAFGRELGLRSVPVELIAGTAVAGPDQRGGDFLPLPPFRTTNWEARWQRIRRATERLAILPPVDLVKFGDRYWVVDGHNRVAAALYSGQAEIDAVVTELRLPGSPPSEEPGSLAPILAETAELRAVASGRWSGTVEPPASVTGLDGGSGAASAPSGSPESAGAGAASGAASAAGGSPETGPDAGSDAAARNEVRADRPSREPDGR